MARFKAFASFDGHRVRLEDLEFPDDEIPSEDAVLALAQSLAEDRFEVWIEPVEPTQ